MRTQRHTMARKPARGLVRVVLVCAMAMAILSCGPTVNVYTIGIVQLITHPSPNSVRDGFVQALADTGYVDGENVKLKFESAEGEILNTQLIAQGFVANRVDMVFAIGTPPLQAVLQETPETIPVVFAFSSDPWGAGAGTSPTDHLPNVAGVTNLSPLEQQVALIRELLPTANRVGVIYDAGKTSSRTEAEVLERAATESGLVVIEQTVASTTEVLEAAKALAGDNVDVFARIGDYATATALSSIVKVSQEACIPIISTTPNDLQEGALAVVGWSYYDAGYDAGQLAVRVMGGESPADMPFQKPSKQVLLVNLVAADTCGIEVPQSVLDQADEVLR